MDSYSIPYEYIQTNNNRFSSKQRINSSCKPLNTLSSNSSNKQIKEKNNINKKIYKGIRLIKPNVSN